MHTYVSDVKYNFHMNNDIECPNLQCKQGGRGLTSIQIPDECHNI